MDEKNNGTVEKDTIPSIEYLNNFQKFHLVFPFFLSIFSYSKYFVSKPTQANIPLENLLESVYTSKEKCPDRTESTANPYLPVLWETAYPYHLGECLPMRAGSDFRHCGM